MSAGPLSQSVIGHRAAKDHLLRQLRSGRLPHALLFSGPEGIGKRTLAVELAHELNCEAGRGAACGVCLACRSRHQLATSHPDIVLARDASRTLWLDAAALARAVLAEDPLPPGWRQQLLQVRDDLAAQSFTGPGEIPEALRGARHWPFILRADKFFRPARGQGDEPQELDRLTQKTATDPRLTRFLATLLALLSPGAFRDLLKMYDVRRHRERLRLKSYRARTKVLIVDDAHRLRVEAQNALLKTLEEPPGDALLILITPFPDQLVEPIRSRCQHIALTPLGDREMRRFAQWEGLEEELDAADLEAVLAVAAGSPRRLLDLVLEGHLGRARRRELVEFLCQWMGADEATLQRDAFRLCEVLVGGEGELRSRLAGALEQLLSLGRDLAVLGVDERAPVHNEECRDVLASLAAALGPWSPHRFVLSLAAALDSLEGNVDPLMVAEQVLYDRSWRRV